MTTHEYWLERARQNEARTYEQKEQAIKELQKAFLEAEDTVVARIESFYRKYGIDGKVSEADARKRLTATELTEMRKRFHQLQLRASSESNAQEMYRLQAKRYISRQEALLAEIRYYITELASVTDTTVEQVLTKIFEDQELHSLYDIEQGLGYEVMFNRMSGDQLKTILLNGYDGRSFSSKIWYDRDTLAMNLTRLIPQQFIAGVPTQVLADKLSKDMKTSYNNAVRLIRTEGTYASAKADMHTYQQCGCEMYEILATLDARTSEICREMDGKVFPVSQASVGVNMPPFHPNCRTTTLPIIDMDDIDEMRLAKDSEGKYIRVPKQTYRQWEASKAR